MVQSTKKTEETNLTAEKLAIMLEEGDRRIHKKDQI